MTLSPNDVADLIDDLSDTLTEAEAIDLVSRTVDALLPLDTVLPGPLGEMLERHDGDLLAALGHWIRDVLTDPERRARQAERRAYIRARVVEHRDAGHQAPKARRLARRDWRARVIG